MINRLPLYYFKPSICWIDDDQLFLDAAKLSFEDDYSCVSFNSPSDALVYFERYQSPLANINFKREFTESDVFGVHDHFPVDVNIPAISRLANFPEKSNEIALLVVDYHMAEMNGLDLCQRLKNFKGKKILLTGEATHECAVEGFNQGLIDKFIKKGANITAILHAYVNELVYEFFCDKTANIVAHLEASRPSLLTDESFITFFAKWRQEHEVEEFYLLNKQGTFLVKDRNGRMSYFVLQSDRDNAEFVKLNDEATGEVVELLAQVERGQLVPFFGEQKESWEVEANDWAKYFYPAQVIKGKENYYWTVVDKK